MVVHEFLLHLYKEEKRQMGLTSQLDHLKMLEAESIHILREVAAEFAHPVMLYSIGKDSSVMLRLAQKAFYPGQDSVPAAAHRHHLQIPGNDRVSRPVRASMWAPS